MLLPFVFEPMQLSLLLGNNAAPGTILLEQDRYLLSARIEDDGTPGPAVVILDRVGDLSYPLTVNGVGECITIVAPRSLRVRLGSRIDTLPRMPDYIGGIVVTADGPALIAGVGIHRWQLSTYLVSLRDGVARPSQSINVPKPVFMEWEIGHFVEGQWTAVVERKPAPSADGL